MSDENLFKFHKLTEEGQQKAQMIATDFRTLLQQIKCHVPEGRELSIVKTKLEEACFFAKKGMAIHNVEKLNEPT
jgi:hypothetical protein